MSRGGARAQLLCGCLALLAAAAAAAGRRQLVMAPRPPAVAYAVSPALLRLLSCGNPALAADWYYLRAVGHFGDKTAHAGAYPQLAPLLERAVRLDPHFLAPYLLAGTALLLGGQDNQAGKRLLAQGMAALPEAWQLPFHRGYFAYASEQDVDAAASDFARAARLPGAPAFLGPVATRLAAESHDPAAGLALLDELRVHSPDAGVRETLTARRPWLLLEVRRQRLAACAAAFRAQRGRAPAQLAELGPCCAQQGGEPLDQVLQDPLGGQFALTPTGAVTSQHEAGRLKAFRPAAAAGKVAP